MILLQRLCGGVDDDIRKLFRAAEAKLKELPDADLEEFSKSL